MLLFGLEVTNAGVLVSEFEGITKIPVASPAAPNCGGTAVYGIQNAVPEPEELELPPLEELELLDEEPPLLEELLLLEEVPPPLEELEPPEEELLLPEEEVPPPEEEELLPPLEEEPLEEPPLLELDEEEHAARDRAIATRAPPAATTCCLRRSCISGILLMGFTHVLGRVKQPVGRSACESLCASTSLPTQKVSAGKCCMD